MIRAASRLLFVVGLLAWFGVGARPVVGTTYTTGRGVVTCPDARDGEGTDLELEEMTVPDEAWSVEFCAEVVS